MHWIQKGSTCPQNIGQSTMQFEAPSLHRSSLLGSSCTSERRHQRRIDPQRNSSTQTCRHQRRIDPQCNSSTQTRLRRRRTFPHRSSCSSSLRPKPSTCPLCTKRTWKMLSPLWPPNRIPSHTPCRQSMPSRMCPRDMSTRRHWNQKASTCLHHSRKCMLQTKDPWSHRRSRLDSLCMQQGPSLHRRSRLDSLSMTPLRPKPSTGPLCTKHMCRRC